MIRAHGVRGALVIAVDPSLAAAISPGKSIELKVGETKRSAELLSASPARGGIVVRVDNIDNRTDAEAVVGADVHMDAEQLPALGEGEYYEHDLVGCTVISQAGDRLGTLTEILKTGANDVYVVSSDDGEVLAPAVEGVILHIDTDSRTVRVTAGALEYSGLGKRRD